MPNLPTVVVLAAGLGSRFKAGAVAGAGVHKLGQPLGDGSVLQQTLLHVLASGLPLVVVTTPALASEAARHVALRDVLCLPDGAAPVGVGHSIAAGVAARCDSPGWLVLPADMPLVRPSTLQAVARALAEHAVAYPQYLGRRGHPVGFSAELYADLAALEGDVGARRVIARYAALAIEVDDPGVLIDIDTESDLDGARAVWRSAQLDARLTQTSALR